MQGVFAVRAAYPAAVPEPARSSRPTCSPRGADDGSSGAPGSTAPRVTIALLDTGVDTRHPFLQGRLVPGLDMVEPGSDASAEQNPTQPGRPERHGTELAGLMVGVRGPAGIHGVAPGAMVLPIRVAGWQPDADGGVSVYGRTDQVLAGLEAAVDPNADGDAHDAVRIALVGVVEPFASFPDAPLATAAAGALALDTLVVAPAGNDGPAGPGYGSVAAPAGAPGRSASRRPTRASEARPCTSSCGPGCGCSPPARPAGWRGPADRSRHGAGRGPPTPAGRRGDGGQRARSAVRRHGYSRVAGAAALPPTGRRRPRWCEARRCGCPRGPRRRADPRGVARRTSPSRFRSSASPARPRPRCARRSRPVFPSSSLSAPRPSTRHGLVPSLPSRAPDSRSTEARGPSSLRRVSASSRRFRPERGWRRALRDDQRLERGRRSGRRRRRAPCRRPSGSRRRRCAARWRRPCAEWEALAGNLDLEAASAVELVADPPVAALGALDAGHPGDWHRRLRNVSRRPLVVRLRRGRPRPA